jgi:predicted DsbA family dithiol-disulfide isomerase
MDQAAAAHLDTAKLNACIQKQDKSAIEASMKIGTGLGIEATPALFINGDKIDGAVPIEFIFNVIDDALRAENVTPPPTYVAPGTTAPPVAGGAGGHGK